EEVVGAVADARDSDCGMDLVYSCHVKLRSKMGQGSATACSGQTTAKPAHGWKLVTQGLSTGYV
ncbi:MAG TPA: hypothetical protein VM656_17785, partial [Pyrinomonadaceae bacterium]|nr:hypothetical protein [Pyrinomonadaceae bacterium]